MTDAPETGRSRRRRLRWALGASVCVNLLLVGLAGGAFLRHGGGPPPAEMPAGFDRVTLWRVYRALPEPDRDAARDMLRARRDEMRDLARSRGEARARIAVTLSRDPFSDAELAAALEAARQAERRSRDLADAIFVEIVARLDPRRRGEIAEALREAQERRDRWHDHGPDRDRDGDREGDWDADGD